MVRCVISAFVFIEIPGMILPVSWVLDWLEKYSLNILAFFLKISNVHVIFSKWWDVCVLFICNSFKCHPKCFWPVLGCDSLSPKFE